MDWSHLKVVLAISRGRTLTRAAQLLGMDQTTAGRRLTALEHQLGTALFVRAKSGFVTTQEGQIVLQSALKIEAEIAQMCDDLVGARDEPTGIVRIMANNWMLERLAEHVLPDLNSQFPRLELMLSGRLPPAPLHGEATVSFWYDASAHPSEIAVPFCQVPYATYSSRNIEIDQRHWVQFRDDDALSPSFSRQVRRRLGGGVNFRLSATDANILKSAIRGGIGQGILPICLGDEDDLLRRVDPTATPITRLLHLHVNPEAAKTLRVQVVLTAVSNAMSAVLSARLLPLRHKSLKSWKVLLPQLKSVDKSRL